MSTIPKILNKRTGCTPITAIASLPYNNQILSASSTDLTLSVSNLEPQLLLERTWSNIFNRERIHRLVVDHDVQSNGQVRVMVVGGKEARLISLNNLDSQDVDEIELNVVCEFYLDDWAGDAAFLNDDRIMISTLHNSIKIYNLPPFPSSPAPISSEPRKTSTTTQSQSQTVLLHPFLTIHAPERPLLWTNRFSKSRYSFDESKSKANLQSMMGMREDREEGEDRLRVRIGGGSLLGHVLVWDFEVSRKELKEDRGSSTSMKKVEGDQNDIESTEKTGREVRRGNLRKLKGHRGAIFTVSFSPDNEDHLASGSDDRTVRIWNLSSSHPSQVSHTEGEEGEEEEEVQVETLWGHEGRVWRIDWVDRSRVVSVAEDATCRLWYINLDNFSTRLSLASTKEKRKGYELIQTWKDGHDGRSIWSVAVADYSYPRRMASNGDIDGVAKDEMEEKGKIVLTGGADGSIRSWILQNVSVTSREPLRNGTEDGKGQRKKRKIEVKSFIIAVNPVSDQPVCLSLATDGSFRLHDPTTSIEHVESFHVSPRFANAPASLHLEFDRSPSNSEVIQVRFAAFSNKGTYLSGTGTLASTIQPQLTSTIATDSIKVDELDIGIKTVFATFETRAVGRRKREQTRKVAIWERATRTIHLVDVSSEPSSSSSPVVFSKIKMDEPQLDSPTCFLWFDNPEEDRERQFLLVGYSSGSISLYAVDGESMESNKVSVHSDGVTEIKVEGLNGTEDGIVGIIESIARDGMKKRIEVVVRNRGGRCEMRVVDERPIAKGVIEQIVPSLGGQGEDRYLALVDTRAVLFDALGHQLVSFESPGKQVPSQFVETRSNGLRYYRLSQGRLHHQSYPSAPTTMLRSGLHGREIRATQAVELVAGQERVTLLATGAENGVLALSQLNSDNSIRPLYINRYLPSSIKSLTFSSVTRNSLAASPTTTLYVCGTRELVASFDITVLPLESSLIPRDSDFELRVVASGMILAETDGGEVRAMDLAVIDSPPSREGQIVVAGYSDGRIRIWHHLQSAWSTLGESRDLGKCILSVEVEKVKVDGIDRVIGIFGRSDGRLSIHDLTSAIESIDSSPVHLNDSILTISPHQSGINGLTTLVQEPSLLVGTAGDDNSISLNRIDLASSAHKNGDRYLVATAQAVSSIVDAHGSTIQGLDFVSPTLLASSSVEQRLNLYSISAPSLVNVDPDSSLKLNNDLRKLELIDSTCLNVADCSAQTVISTMFTDDDTTLSTRVVVVGIGLDVLEISQ